MLTTFASTHENFYWLRLSLGVSVLSEIFQNHLHQELQGLTGINCIADDVLIYDKDDAEYDCNQQKGIKLNREKLEYKCKEVIIIIIFCFRFFVFFLMGHLLTAEGILVASAPVLSYYEPGKPLELQCDSSHSGLGVALMQGGHPIAYASMALT